MKRLFLFIGFIILASGCMDKPEGGTPFRDIFFSEKKVFFDSAGGLFEVDVLNDYSGSCYQVPCIQDLDNNVYYANLEETNPFGIDGLEVSISGNCVSVKASACAFPRRWLVYLDNVGPGYGLYHGCIEVYQE